MKAAENDPNRLLPVQVKRERVAEEEQVQENKNLPLQHDGFHELTGALESIGNGGIRINEQPVPIMAWTIIPEL
jgi:hypothetical protein